MRASFNDSKPNTMSPTFEEAELLVHDEGEGVTFRVRIAKGFWGRGLGLMLRRPLAKGLALWLSPCSSIHTCFMRFSIDAIFLDTDARVVRVHRGLRPWRFAMGGTQATSVLEASSGWLDLERVRPGTRLLGMPERDAAPL